MESTGNANLYHHNINVIRYTPRQLIKYHMEHPEEPITDEHIKNLVLDVSVVSSLQDENKPFKNNRSFNYS